MYEIFNGIAHICMIILVLEALILPVGLLLAIGAGGLFAEGFIKNRLGRLMPRARQLPGQANGLVERVCGFIAWPVIQGTSLWRGVKAGAAALRRQATQQRTIRP